VVLTGSGIKMKLKTIGLTDVNTHESVVIVEPSNIYGCRLAENVFIGPFCEIQNDVVIGPQTRIQSHTFICSYVTIGANCFVGHGVMFINDKFEDGSPAKGDKSKWRSTVIGANVAIGSNATILPVTICDNVTIGAGSVVTRSIVKPGKYAGSPARKMGD